MKIYILCIREAMLSSRIILPAKWNIHFLACLKQDYTSSDRIAPVSDYCAACRLIP